MDFNSGLWFIINGICCKVWITRLNSSVLGKEEDGSTNRRSGWRCFRPQTVTGSHFQGRCETRHPGEIMVKVQEQHKASRHPLTFSKPPFSSYGTVPRKKTFKASHV
ncbi:Hypothetical predicted protein [Xyrichtys novacula]|uniref:Uncharacterized protein n=1 Tax=Xyrichtys novacula TaxID=13765 RepID=A0AAV1F4P9_XYRNO|nr:Hypothetical predicted protein [Xyrichtys novacula]